MKSKIIILIALFLSNIAAAQSKVGTINSDYLMGLMPEGKIVVEQIQSLCRKNWIHFFLLKWLNTKKA